MSLKRSLYHRKIEQSETHNMFELEHEIQNLKKPKVKWIITCILSMILSCCACSYVFYQTGYQSGNSNGYNAGFETGKNEGYNEGYKTGKQDGDIQGFERGYEFSKNENTEKNLTINQFSDWWDKNKDNYKENFSIEKNSKENKCAVNGCSNSKKYESDYCFSHGCIKASCYNRRANNLTMYCKEHKCAVSDCNSGTAYNSRYCYVHR